MDVRGREITSICMMNIEEDGSIVGTVVNEMGVKAFDFTYANGKAKVINVLGPFNKWYIRKVLRKDFSFILSNISKNQNVVWKKRSMTVSPNGDIIIKNDRFNISYTFTPMNANHETDQ